MLNEWEEKEEKGGTKKKEDGEKKHEGRGRDACLQNKCH